MADLVQEATRAAATWLEENEGASPRCAFGITEKRTTPSLLQRGGAGCILPIWGRSATRNFCAGRCAWWAEVATAVAIDSVKL